LFLSVKSFASKYQAPGVITSPSPVRCKPQSRSPGQTMHGRQRWATSRTRWSRVESP
jgi:hypothetical protein